MKMPMQRRGQYGGALVKLIALLGAIALLAVMYFARHALLRLAAESWVVNEPTIHADAIVVLGDDNFYADRATHATELFREGVATEVVASGRRLRPGAGISELIEHDLIERGVPKQNILRFAHDADSTREEAMALEHLADQHKWKSIVVVTSNYHARRTRYIFRETFPARVTVTVGGARDGDFDPELWWTKRKSIKLFVRELAGMVDALWEMHAGSKSE